VKDVRQLERLRAESEAAAPSHLPFFDISTSTPRSLS